MKVGDTVIRMLGGEIPMKMVIMGIQDGIITCSALQDDGSQFNGGWTFDETTKAEIDEDLKWGPKYGITGSFIKEA